jgi:hypothetical protein
VHADLGAGLLVAGAAGVAGPEPWRSAHPDDPRLPAWRSR